MSEEKNLKVKIVQTYLSRAFNGVEVMYKNEPAGHSFWWVCEGNKYLLKIHIDPFEKFKTTEIELDLDRLNTVNELKNNGCEQLIKTDETISSVGSVKYTPSISSISR